ncbi:hypothetical protein [Pelagibius sp.]|uniref:hypothetical protein n=1 Tax=Pelagibius sp. TaxID=1931238 RepID=UPI003BB173A6
MISKTDVYRSASVLIREYGDFATIETALRADAFLAQGSIAGQRIWLRILAAVEELQRTEPKEDTKVH